MILTSIFWTVLLDCLSELQVSSNHSHLSINELELVFVHHNENPIRTANARLFLKTRIVKLLFYDLSTLIVKNQLEI
jgi:hypothetical protein